MGERTTVIVLQLEPAPVERPEVIIVAIPAPAALAQQPPQPPQPPVPPTPPEAPVIVNGERTAPGVITIERDGRTITLDGAPGADGTTSELGGPGNHFDLPPNVYLVARDGIIGLTLMVIAFPVFGFLKALVNRRANTQALMPPRDTTDRLQRIESAVETMSVEVERISEGQRFVTKVLAERTTSQP